MRIYDHWGNMIEDATVGCGPWVDGLLVVYRNHWWEWEDEWWEPDQYTVDGVRFKPDWQAYGVLDVGPLNLHCVDLHQTIEDDQFSDMLGVAAFPAAVPEPSGAVLLMAGLATLLACRWLRAKLC